MTKYELWYFADDEVESYTMFLAGQDPKNHGVEEGSVLEKVFDAVDWNDAKRQQHEYMGWEPYVPLED